METTVVFTSFTLDGEIVVEINDVQYTYYIDGAHVERIRRQSLKSPKDALNAIKRFKGPYITGGKYYEADTSI